MQLPTNRLKKCSQKRIILNNSCKTQTLALATASIAEVSAWGTKEIGIIFLDFAPLVVGDAFCYLGSLAKPGCFQLASKSSIGVECIATALAEQDLDVWP